MPAHPLFDYGKIVKAYKVFGSTRKAAKAIGCSNYTVCMVVRAAGLRPTEQGLTAANRWRGGRGPGTVAKWSRAHPDVIIPLRAAAIEKLIGCPRKDAYHYLEWRRKYFMKKVMRLPNLQPYLNEEYSIYVNKKKLHVVITPRTTKKLIVLNEDELESLLGRLTS
jgi:hypothetical protein